MSGIQFDASSEYGSASFQWLLVDDLHWLLMGVISVE